MRDDNRTRVRLDGAPLFEVVEGLEDLFPGTGLSDLFHTSSSFRHAIRRATREDLFSPNPKWTDEANRRIVDSRSTLMVAWLTSKVTLQRSGDILYVL